jgi:hypothetical protein
MDYSDAVRFCGAEPDDNSGQDVCAVCGQEREGWYDAQERFECSECIHAALKAEHGASAAAPAEQQQEQRPEFHITDEAGANWYARRLASIEAERARVRAQAAQIVAQLDADEKSLRDRFEAQAREWARAELAKRGNRRKSLVLLQGTFAFRTVPATLRVDDVAAALNTAVEVGAVKVDADAYRRHARGTLKATGEILPGCVHQGEHENFAVRFGKDAGIGGE